MTTTYTIASSKELGGLVVTSKGSYTVRAIIKAGHVGVVSILCSDGSWSLSSRGAKGYARAIKMLAEAKAFVSA